MITPDIESFKQKAAEGNLIPVYREILADQDTPVSVYDRLRRALKARGEKPFTYLFESVEGGENVARYSFLGGMPRCIFKGQGRKVTLTHEDGHESIFEDVEPLSVVQDYMKKFKPVKDHKLPSFIGGAVGYIGHEIVAQFDKVNISDKPGIDVPDMLYAFMDTVVVFDRATHSIKLVTSAFIENGNEEESYAAAVERLEDLAQLLKTPLSRSLVDVISDVEDLPLKSNTEHQEFLDNVEKCQEYIRAGDIIQVVLSQRFEVEGEGDPLIVYRALRSLNPSPYMFCMEFDDVKLIGTSPEIHVRGEEGRVTIRPIAGTRIRTHDPVQDKVLEAELLADPKERAEHVMLVDLARNDIGRVCKMGSVELDEFMIIEKYSHVMHIVSNVVGELDPAYNVYDLMRATFPAGTLSGAPKIRAMDIIAELENNRRGPYGGAVGYFSFDDNLDCCITIRTVIMHGGKSYVQAGAGIVADSVPQSEYEETQNKARGMLKAIAMARNIAEREAQS